MMQAMKVLNLNAIVNFSLPKTVNAKNARVSIVKSPPIPLKIAQLF